MQHYYVLVCLLDSAEQNTSVNANCKEMLATGKEILKSMSNNVKICIIINLFIHINNTVLLER